MTALVITSVTSLTLVLLHRERQQLRQELEHQATMILNTLVASSRDDFYARDFDAIEVMMEQLQQELNQGKLLTAGRAYQEDGRLVSDVYEPDVKIYSLEVDPWGKTLLQSPTIIFEWRSNQLLAGQVVRAGDESLGAISIGLSTAPLQAQLATTRQYGLGLALVAGLVGTGLARLISRSITGPLKTLTQATHRMAAGELNQAIQVTSQDELAVLTQAFNHMTQQVQCSIQRLEEQQAKLRLSEAQASEKAAALEQALQELRLTQGQLVQNEKMASLGQLVAGIAHEINNPVSFIAGNIQPAQRYAEDLLALIELYVAEYATPSKKIQALSETIDLKFLMEDFPRLLHSLQVGSERITGIVKSLKTFSRLDETDKKPTDLQAALDSTLMILHNRLKATSNRPEIEVIKQDNPLPKVTCCGGSINQVFMNILVNAIDALEEHCEKQFEESSWSPQITLTNEVFSNAVVIVIADNGPGILPGVREKLFDPFFTTKPVGKGTGLGLSISYKIIVEQHHGSLDCLSELGKGTKFVIKLPLS
ncbi:ATP-binding protein [Leptolyngbya sp. AN02str]|uniref:ATP-binding protein n=1 Tax=Leptolyngbya sp. AN02str TaxID=3423363 RepID=UPI003D312DB0